MKLMGGEVEYNDNGIFKAVTDCGRSSLRLILENGFRSKKILLPDYLCGIIIDTLKAYKTPYAFYRVKEDLTIDWASVKRQNFDVLYVIDYFGQRQVLNNAVIGKRWVIIDQVFDPLLTPPSRINNWMVFNSLRKVTVLSDGSLLAASKLLDQFKLSHSGEFASLKYKAKQLKYHFLHHKQGSEQVYLDVFKKAEQALDRQKFIGAVSQQSLQIWPSVFAHLPEEQLIRRRNFKILSKHLKLWQLSLKPSFVSFFVLSVDDRDGLREYLRGHRCYLPVHWPPIKECSNALYDRVISIPVDSRYAPKDIEHVAMLIKRFMTKRGKHV